jgi:phosphatidate cytidylyltransferase
MSDDRPPLFDEPEDEQESSPAPTVRITGATPASDSLFDDLLAEEPAPPMPETELPHWTEDATGQVPAVLSRPDADADADADPWSSVQSPTWREDDSDWVAEEEAFDASLLSSVDEEITGALVSEQELEERQPWEFDLGEEPVPAESALPGDDILDPPTEAIPVVADPEAEPPVRRRGAHSRGSSTDRSRSRARGRGADRAEDANPIEGGPTEGSSTERTHAAAQQGASADRNIPVAVATGVIIALLVLVTFDIGTVLAMLLVIVVVTLAAAEAYAAFRRGHQHPATLLGLVATITLMIATYNRGTQALGLVSVLLFFFTIVWFMAGHDRKNMLTGLSSTMLVFVWVGVFGSFAGLLLNPNLFPDRHGLAFLLGAILATISYDIAALFVGASMGKRPLAPAISPAKTVEGLIGGSAAAILMSVIVVQLIHPWTLASALTLGIVVSIVAPLGDLAESMIKRNLGLKDMGRLLPGHGGMLDRVDGLLFVLPATYFVVRAFHLG